MELIDKILLEWSYRCEKGYPDLNNKEDLKIFEELFGINPTVTELEKRDYDVLNDKSKALAEKIMAEFGVKKEQIIPASSTHIVIYSKDRPSLLYSFEQSGEYGPNLLSAKGKFKVDGITITLKPTGEKAGESYNLKPQQLGITLDKKITLETLKKELIDGVNNNQQLSPVQKQALIYSLTGDNKLTEEEIKSLSSGFFNEVRKNFGEPHGALIYGKEQGADSVFFPSKGNYRMIDYILYKGEDQTQVSAKAAKTTGNTVKYEDVIKLIDQQNGDVPPTIRTYAQIITNNTVYAGAFAAIEKFGNQELKSKVSEYLEKYPQFPKLGKKPEDEQSHADRIAIERDFVKYLNTEKPELDFNEIFNQYIAVRYVKYDINQKTLEASIQVIDSGNFNVTHRSKNTPNHDSDKLGLDVKSIS